MNDTFDPLQYWDQRHRDLAGDFRNVGYIGLTSEQNYEDIAAKCVLVANVLGSLGVGRGQSVLDAGCGAGAFTKLLNDAGFDVSGVDTSPYAIEEARRATNAHFTVAPLDAMQLDRSFDAVLCIDVLFHVVDDEKWSQSVARLLQHTKPGGTLLIIEHFPPEGAKAAQHVRWRSLAAYESIFGDLGAKGLSSSVIRYPHTPAPKSLLVVRR